MGCSVTDKRNTSRRSPFPTFYKMWAGDALVDFVSKSSLSDLFDLRGDEDALRLREREADQGQRLAVPGEPVRVMFRLDPADRRDGRRAELELDHAAMRTRL